MRTQLGGKGSEKTIPDVEALERPISDLRSQLDCAAQTIVEEDNNLERLDKEKEKLQQAYNRGGREDAPNRGYAGEGRSVASWDRYKRGKGANVKNDDQARQTLT